MEFKLGAYVSKIGSWLMPFSLFGLVGCIEPIDSSTDICLNVPTAQAVGIKKIYYGPFTNQQAAQPQDTVSLEDFGFNLELDLLAADIPSANPIFSNSNQVACQGIYTITNISNISVILNESFSGIPAGTDISYLFITPEGQSIAQLRTFDRVSAYIGAKLNFRPANYSQLNTRTFLFLRDGTQVFLDSTSPFLKIR